MGYTHYWTAKPIKPLMWRRVMKDFEVLFAAAKQDGYVIAKEYNEPEIPPVIDEKHIRFNGIGKNGHETFWIGRDDDQFMFCKTNHRRYDAVVTAALIYLARTQGYVVESDGTAEEWLDGLVLARSVWPGIDLKLPEGVEE